MGQEKKLSMPTSGCRLTEIPNSCVSEAKMSPLEMEMTGEKEGASSG